MTHAWKVAALLLALIHVYILVLEMFLWTTKRGQRVFGMTPEYASSTAVLAKNQGLYNGFLAAGLIWALLIEAPTSLRVAHFFVGCILVAGVYGGVTAKKSILYVQALPAAITYALLLGAR